MSTAVMTAVIGFLLCVHTGALLSANAIPTDTLAPPPRANVKDGCGWRPRWDTPPVFSGCEDVAAAGERRRCSDSLLVEYVYSHLRYPTTALMNEVEGKVIIGFVIEADGTIDDVRVVRGPEAGCREEARRIVCSFPPWVPAEKDGHPIPAAYVIPVHFRLSSVLPSVE